MRALFAAISNLLTLLFTLLGMPFRLLRSRHRPSYVLFRLRGDPPHRRQMGLRRRLLARRDREQVGSLEELGAELTTLKADPTVRGVVFRFDELAAAPSKREVLRNLFQELRVAGKEVVAFAISASNSEYSLMTAADRIVLPAGGRIELVGYAAEATALGTALERVGVKAQFVRRGDYKTAPELFTHPQVSDIQRQTIAGLLDEQYERLIQSLVQGRKMSVDEAKKRIDGGPYSSHRALANGLCDGICSEADLPAYLGLTDRPARMPERTQAEEDASAEEDSLRLVSFSEYNAFRRWPVIAWRRIRRRPRVGVVSVSGMILPGDGRGVPLGPKLAGSDSVVKALRAARRDRRAKAVVLYITSPGGSALASEMILEEVKRLARRKPVIAFCDRVAASGGYMVALGAREIWTDASAIVGSIGVYAGKFDVSGLLERLGIHRTVMTRGENAGFASPSRGLTEHERAALEAEVEETYQVFLGHVATARKMTKEAVHQLAEGRVYSGTRAKQMGLVDRVGGFEEACRRALEWDGKPALPFDVIVYQGAGRPGLASFLRMATGSHVYALTWPMVELRG